MISVLIFYYFNTSEPQRYYFLFTFLTSFTATIPVISPVIIILPTLMLTNNWFWGFMLIALPQIVLYYVGDSFLVSDSAHPYLTGTFAIMGISAFGIGGIIKGPILLWLTMLVIDHIKQPFKRNGKISK